MVRLLNADDDPVDPVRRDVLLQHTGAVAGVAPRLPEALREAVTAEAERAVKDVASRGWELVGPTEDLLPGVDAFAARPDEVTPPTGDVVRAQTEVLRALVHDGTRRGPAGLRRRALRVLRERVRP